MLARARPTDPAVPLTSGAAVTLDAGGTAEVAAALVVSYLLGSVPAAVVVARRRRVDIRAVGDRNPGFWNARAALGARAAAPVLVIDAAKGAAAALLGTFVAHRLGRPPGVGWLWSVPYLCGLAAMVGHAWPVLARFRGGRCVLTFLGAWLVINPGELLGAAGVGLVVYAVLRRFSPAVRVGVACLPVIQAFTDPRSRVAMTGVMMTLIGLRFLQAALAARAAHAAGAGPTARPAPATRRRR